MWWGREREGKGRRERERERAGRKEGGRERRKREGEDYIFQYHQREVKIDKLRNDSINLLFRIWRETTQKS